jgi:hypothetical protein
MQAHTERRTGMDRRQFDLSSTITTESVRRWKEISPDGGSDDPYDPYDPYWEPMKGQDDD